MAGQAARGARDEPPRLRDAHPDAVELPDARVAAKLEGDLRGPVECGRLEHVSAPEGSARDIHREAAIRIVVTSENLRPRLAFFREPEGFEMLKLLVREAVVHLRKVDVHGRSSDPRQAVG